MTARSRLTTAGRTSRRRPTSAGGAQAAQAEPDAAAGEGFGDGHRSQDGAGLERPAAARRPPRSRTRRPRSASASAASAWTWRMPRLLVFASRGASPPLTTTSGISSRTRRSRSSRRSRTRAISGSAAAASSAATPPPTTPGDVLGPAAPVPLLRPAGDERGHPHAPPQVEHADALWPVELVRRDGRGVAAEGGEVDRDLAGRLRGVDVQRHAAVPAERGDGGDVGQDARLVVGPDDRRHRRPAEGDLEGVEVEPALPVDRDGDDLGPAQVGDGRPRGVVLDGGGDDLAAAALPEEAADGGVGRLGAGGGEGEFAVRGSRAGPRSARGRGRRPRGRAGRGGGRCWGWRSAPRRTAAWPRRPAGRAGWWRCCRGRRGGPRSLPVAPVVPARRAGRYARAALRCRSDGNPRADPVAELPDAHLRATPRRRRRRDRQARRLVSTITATTGTWPSSICGTARA